MPVSTRSVSAKPSSDTQLYSSTRSQQPQAFRSSSSRATSSASLSRMSRGTQTLQSPSRLSGVKRKQPPLTCASVNGLEPKRLASLFEKSQAILAGNSVTRTINGESYTGTMPSREFYVHQWFWDSATHAMSLADTQPDKALDELASLCLGQWDNGFIAQIQFFPEEGDKIYFPGSECWHTQAHAPQGIQTSGITQPPIISMASPKVLNAVLETLPDNPSERTTEQQRVFERACQVLESTYAYNAFLKGERDPEDSGLITVVHPWESGLDNAPQWDQPLQHSFFDTDKVLDRVKHLVDTGRKDVVAKKDGKKAAESTNQSERPEQKKYYDYMMLVDRFNEMNWDQKAMAQNSPFRVKDVLFTSIFTAGCDDLAEFYQSDTARRFGLEDQSRAEILQNWAEQSRTALKGTWDDEMGRYLCQDLNQPEDSALRTDTISGFAPLLAGLGDDVEKTQQLLDALDDPDKYNTTFSVPTAAKDNPAFELKRYWRGCVWPITNFLLSKGLERTQARLKNTHPDVARRAAQTQQRLTSELNQLVDKVGFQEYYIPTAPIKDQTKIGFGKFSWTAAIFMMNNVQEYKAMRDQPETKAA